MPRIENNRVGNTPEVTEKIIQDPRISKVVENMKRQNKIVDDSLKKNNQTTERLNRSAMEILRSSKKFFNVEALNSLKRGAGKIGDEVAGNVNEVLDSSVKEVVDHVKNFGVGMFNMIKSIPSFLNFKSLFGEKDEEKDFTQDVHRDLKDDIGPKLDDFNVDQNTEIELLRGLIEEVKASPEAYAEAFRNMGINREMFESLLRGNQEILDNNFQELIDQNDEMYKLELRKEEPEKSKDGIWALLGLGLIGSAFALFGGIIGGFAYRFQKTYEVIFKTTKLLGSAIKNVFAMFKETGPLGFIARFFKRTADTFKGASKFLAPIGKAFGWLKSFGLKVGRIVTRIPAVSAFLRGFSKLALPITLILSAVDFVRGFMSEKGDIVDKIKAGLSSAVRGFVEMPLKLLGWVTDWFLEKVFGIQDAGTGQKMVDGLMWAVDKGLSIVLFPFKILVGGVKKLIEFVQSAGDFITPIFDKLSSYMSGIKSLVLDYTPIGWLYKGTKKLWDFFSGAGEDEQFDIFGSIMEIFTNLTSRIKDWFQEKIANLPFTKALKGFFSFFTEEKPEAREAGGPVFRKQAYVVGEAGPELFVPDVSGKIVPQEDIGELEAQKARYYVMGLKKQLQAQLESVRAFDNLGAGFKKTTEDQISTLYNINNMVTTPQRSPESGSFNEPPDEIESFGLLLTNKNWGMS